MKKNSIVFFLSESMFLGLGITDLLNTSNTDSIISIIIGGLLSFILFFFINRIVNYSDNNFFNKSIKLYGKVVGSIINIILIILFSLYFIYTLFNLNTYIHNKYLDNTPSLLILTLFLLPVLFLSIKDYKVILKVSLILFVIIIFNIIISYTNLLPLIDIDNYKPIIVSNNIIISSIKYVSYFIIPTFLIVNIPGKKDYLFLLISFINILVLFLLIIGIYGIDLSKTFYYPEFILLKKINYFNFIEHIENILSCNWLFSLFITSVMCLKFIKDYNDKLFYLLIVISIFSCKLFQSNIDSYNFMKNNYILFTIPIILIIFLMNIKIKRNKN